MADGRQQHDWGQTASLMCLHANLNRDPKKGKPLKPSDFMPKKQEPVRKATAKDIQDMKSMFTRKGTA